MASALFGASNEMAELVRTHDWSSTPLGPIERWPRSLVSYVSLILELPTPAIIFWGEQQTQIYNDGYAVIMGPRHPRYFGATYGECWPETYPLIYPWMRDVLDRGEVVRVENTHIPLTRYGFEEEAYFTFTFNALRDDDGRIAGIYQPVTEVTDAVLAQRRSETLRSMSPLTASGDPLEHARVALAASTNDVRFAVIFEWTGEQLELVARIGDQSERDFSAVARRVSDAGRPARDGDVYLVPLRAGQDGMRRGVVVFGISPRLHFDDRYRAFFDAAGSQIAGVLASRHSRREAKRHAEVLAELDTASKAAAQRERQRLHAALMNAPGPFCMLTGEALVIEFLNDACMRVWDRDERIIGKGLLDALPELRDQVFPQLLLGVLHSGDSVQQQGVLAQIRASDGIRDVYFDFSYEPLRDETGQVSSVLVFAVDVTHQVVARRAVEHALDEARRANQAKDEFLAMLGHEMRNPMAPIVTALDMMKLRGDRDVTREREVIERQAKQLVRLVDDLLDISRITRGAFELTRSRLSLAHVVSRAVETTAPLFKTKGHSLFVTVADELVVDADPDRLHQVFSNLLTNAAKFTPAGGRIEITGRQDDRGAVVCVRDNGAGIAPDVLGRVFDMFVQARQDIDRSQGGLGLGLSIVRAIVERHDGVVTARSEGRGRGSEFEVRLPLVNELPDVARTGTDARIKIADSAGRILIVDDNVDAASLLADAVEALGHRACVVHDGPAALEIADQFRPDVALLDIGLPVMDGYEVARQLRSHEATAPIHLVAITGYGQENDREESRRAGFDAHMVKPVDIAQLAATIEGLIVGR
jgi:signal transduction histidine kinase